MNPQNTTNTGPGSDQGINGTLDIQNQLQQQATEAAKNLVDPTQGVDSAASSGLQATPLANQSQPMAQQSPQVIAPTANPVTPQVSPQPQLSTTTPVAYSTPQTMAQPQANIQPPIMAQTPASTNFGPTPPSSGGVPTVVMGGVDNPIVSPDMPGNISGNNSPGGSKKKVVIISALSALLVAGLVSAFMFLWYIPNQPGNVWNTGLSRTGKQFDVLIEKLQDEEATKKLEKSAFTVKGTLTVDSQNYTVDVDSKYDPKNSASTVKVSGSGNQSDNNFAIDAEVRTQLIADAVFPNIYFKLSGFNSLGADTLLPGAGQYDNKWIAVEQDFLKKISDESAPVNGQENLTQKDAASIVSDLNTVSKEYVFTDDVNKAVIQQTKFIATEDSEGIKANHYKAKINAANARTYCAAVVDKLSQNAAVKKIVSLPDSEFAAEVKKQKEECGKATIDENEFDMWVDKKVKIIHKIRQYEDLEKAKKEAETKKAKCLADMAEYSDLMGDSGASYCSIYDGQIETGERYSEFGQVFKNKDSVLLFTGAKSATNKDTSNVRGEVVVNVKDLTAEGSIKATAEGENKYNLDVTLATKPFDGSVDSSKPDGAIPLQQVLDSLGLSSEL